MKVLIIEDDQGIVESLTICFELMWDGSTVISAFAGEKGIELTRAESPDVIILDLGLPDMGGFVVLRHIRSFSNVPIIILTARTEETDRVKGLELGADDYITKPFTPADFLTRVKSVLHRGHVAKEPTAGEKNLVKGKL